MRLIKRIIYAVIVYLVISFFRSNVFALPDCSLINQAQLYDVYSATSVSPISTNTGYSTSMLCEKHYWAAGTSDNTAGMGWSIRLSELYPKNYNYQITFYLHLEDVGGGVPYIINSPFRSNNMALNDFDLATGPWTNGIFNKTGNTYNYSNYEQQGGYSYRIITYITRADKDFSFIFLPFATSYRWTGSFYLAGLEIKNLGQSALSESQINNLLTQQTTQIQNDLNSLNSSITYRITSMETTIDNGLSDINDTMNDDNVDSNNTTDTINNLSSQIASNNVISDLLLLPVSLFQNILNSINGTCSSFSLGSLYNSNINLPCIDLQNILGSTLYTSIDILISGIFILSIRKKFVNIFENLSSLKNGGNELE